jgi:DNA-binding Lrp family transcriptional regulator
MEGFAFIQGQRECLEEAARRIAALEGVMAVEAVTGAYDLVALVGRSSEDTLVRRLEEEIQSIPGVTRVLVSPLASHARIWEYGVESPALVGVGG